MRLASITLHHRTKGYYETAELLLEPRDLWIGVFIKSRYEVYIALLPMIVIHITRS